MECLHHDLYPYLRIHLTEQQIEGRVHGNCRPLTCALKTIDQFFDAVFVSEIGKIHFAHTAHELQLASDAYLAKRSFNPYFYGHIGLLDGLAVRVPMPSQKEHVNPLDFMTRKGFCAYNCQAIGERCT
jgi:hypothetical protein